MAGLNPVGALNCERPPAFYIRGEAADSGLQVIPAVKLVGCDVLVLQGGDSMLREVTAASIFAADVLPHHHATRRGVAKES